MRLVSAIAAGAALIALTVPIRAETPFVDAWVRKAEAKRWAAQRRPRRAIQRRRARRTRRTIQRRRITPAKSGAPRAITSADPRCFAPLAIVGDQAPSWTGAKAQAQKAWGQEARFRYGELFADIRYARNAQYRCVESSIRNSLNRATEAVGISSRLKRCEMQARPCEAKRTSDVSDRND